MCIVGSSSSHREKYPVSFAFSANDYDPKKVYLIQKRSKRSLYQNRNMFELNVIIDQNSGLITFLLRT